MTFSHFITWHMQSASPFEKRFYYNVKYIRNIFFFVVVVVAYFNSLSIHISGSHLALYSYIMFLDNVVSCFVFSVCLVPWSQT